MEQTPVALTNEVVEQLMNEDRPPVVEEEQPGKEPEAAELEAEVSEREVPEKPSPAEEVASLRAEIESLKGSLEAKADLESIETLRSEARTAQEEVGREMGQRHEEAQRSAAEMQTLLDSVQSKLSGLQATVGNLARLVEPEAERDEIDPTTVPPSVLEEAYERIASEVFQRMLVLHGDAATSMTRLAMEAVRRSAAGMEFFTIAEDHKIVVSGLAEALERRSISPHQINITFNEFMRRLLAHVPGYQPASLRDLVEAGSRAFSVATATELTKQQADVVGRLEAQERRFASLERRLGGLVNELKAPLASLEEQSRARLAEMATQSEESQAKLAEMADQAERSLAAIAERVSALEGGLQRLERTLASLKKEAPRKPRKKKRASSAKAKGDK